MNRYAILNVNRYRGQYGIPCVLLTDIVTATSKRLALLSRIAIQISNYKYLDDKLVTNVGRTTGSGDWDVLRRDHWWRGWSLQKIKPIGRVTITTIIIIIRKNLYYLHIQIAFLFIFYRKRKPSSSVSFLFRLIYCKRCTVYDSCYPISVPWVALSPVYILSCYYLLVEDIGLGDELKILYRNGY